MGRRGDNPYGMPKKGHCDWHRGAAYIEFTKPLNERPGFIKSITMCHNCKRLVNAGPKPVMNLSSKAK